MSDETATEWLKRQQYFRRLHDGQELTPQRLGNDFLRMRPAERAKLLHDVKTKLDESELTLNEAHKLHAFRRQLIRSHEAALKVNR
jgi:hypothetical protein